MGKGEVPVELAHLAEGHFSLAGRGRYAPRLLIAGDLLQEWRRIHYDSIRRHLSTLLQAGCMPSAANSARSVGRVLTILPSARRNYRDVPVLP
jgi:hypothetical protein